MDDQHANQPEQLAARLAHVEELFMHLQRTVQDLDQVVILQGKRLDTLERKVSQFAVVLETLAPASEQEPPLSESKPPHY